MPHYGNKHSQEFNSAKCMVNLIIIIMNSKNIQVTYTMIKTIDLLHTVFIIS